MTTDSDMAIFFKNCNYVSRNQMKRHGLITVIFSKILFEIYVVLDASEFYYASPLT
jgi:hypothetical protein